VSLGKALGMSVAGIALGILAGIVFALILVFVVSREFSGWTIALVWPIRFLAEQGAIIVAASSVANLYPALVASRTPVTEFRRENI
jgi:ABC-type antimicrobial peptide transport system permease subunit